MKGGDFLTIPEFGTSLISNINTMEDPSLHKGISPRVQRSEHKSDPRVLTRDDLDDAPNQRQCCEISRLSYLDTHIDTDLDVAYSILFEEANNEYIKERENEEQTKASGKSLIPQRVYQSFLDSVERDVSDYVLSFLSFDVVDHFESFYSTET